MDKSGGWRTVGGRRIFIKAGQDLSTAMRESGKFNSSGGADGESGNKKATTKEEIQELKEKQFEIIKKHNPMTDDYHVGIRKPEDIKTFSEALKDDESFEWGDYTLKDAKLDLKSGFVTVYSSYDIKQGGFVSTSKNQARDYAGGKQVKSKKVAIEDVAWINGDEGQYAKVKN